MSLWKSLEERIKRDEPLDRHTTFGVGGPADYFFEADSIDALKKILLYCENRKLRWAVIGGGSNLLVADEGYRGCVIKLAGHFEEIMQMPKGVRAWAAASISALVRRSAEMGFKGLECLAGIPGTVGGALVMNAGGNYGVIGDYVASVHCLGFDGAEAHLSKKELAFGYRSSSLRDYIVISADFRLKKGDPEKVKQKINEIIQEKIRTQPLNAKSAGCVFKNPPGGRAGELIDKAGLKLARVGGACVSDRHANYILNDGGATADDIIRLVTLVRAKVKEAFGVELELEIKVIR